jgi:hypothetical protein
MLEAIGAGVTPRVGGRDWKDIWTESPEFKKVKQEIQDIKAAELAHPAEDKRNITTCTFLLLFVTYFNGLHLRCNAVLVPTR